jgi:hypothetical protein
MNVDVKIGAPYEEKYHGTWHIRTLTVEQAGAALRNLASGKDKVAYINALMLASVAGPVDLLGNSNELQKMPYRLYRELMDKVLELNETSAEEANFSPSSPSATAQ